MQNSRKTSVPDASCPLTYLDRHGVIAAVSRMAFGNKMGVKLEHNMDPRDLFAPAFGDIIAEVADGQVGSLQITYTVIGEVTDRDFRICRYADQHG